MPEKLATRMMHWRIDCGAQLTRAKPPIQLQNGKLKNLHNGKFHNAKPNAVYITRSVVLPRTDYCALSLHSIFIHRRSVRGGTLPPPPKKNTKFLLASLTGTRPPKIFTGYIMIWKVYLKRISNFFKKNFKNFLKIFKNL